MTAHTKIARRKPSSDRKVTWFTGAGVGTATISIAREGRVRFNAGFLHTHKLQAYSGVELGYDVQGPRILFRFTKAAADGRRLKLHVHDGGKVANVKAFFTAHRLDVRRYVGRYTAVPVHRNGSGPTFAIALERTPRTGQS